MYVNEVYCTVYAIHTVVVHNLANPAPDGHAVASLY